MQATVIVTGGLGGIGGAVARTLAAEGNAVIATGVDPAEIARFEPAEGLTPVRLDVTSDDEVANLVGSVQRLAGVVNCAGVIQRAGREFEIDGFQRTLEVNLVGTMRMCLAARAPLAENGGAIVNFASMLSYFGSPFAPGYAASKGGVVQLTKSLAAAWAGDGIRVNAVAPGWISTDLTRALEEDEARSAAILSRTPMGRWGKPADVGEVVAFLLSAKAGFMTGAVVPVDGGYSSV